MKKIVTIAAIIVVIILLILYKLHFDEKEAKAQKKPPPTTEIKAEAYLVRDTSVEYQVVTVGSIRANESVQIVSEISRKVTGIYMNEGSFVKQNQLLIKLDDADLLAKQQKLKAQEELAVITEKREKQRLLKGGISQQHYDEVANQLKVIQAELQSVEVDLSKTNIIAPFAGKIGLRNISLGAFVSPNTVLANLQDLSKVKIDFAVPERYANTVKVNQTIFFTLDYSPDVFQARVEAFEPSIDTKTRTLLIRAIADNRGNQFVAGTSVKVNLNLKEINQSIFVPSESLIPTQKGYRVFVLRNSLATFSDVKTGIRTKSSVQILEGLNKGDTIVTTNILRIKPNTPIKVIKLG